MFIKQVPPLLFPFFPAQIKDLKAWCAQSNKLTSLQTCEAKNFLADAVKHLNTGEELKQTSSMNAKGTQKWLLVQRWWAVLEGAESVYGQTVN